MKVEQVEQPTFAFDFTFLFSFKTFFLPKIFTSLVYNYRVWFSFVRLIYLALTRFNDNLPLFGLSRVRGLYFTFTDFVCTPQTRIIYCILCYMINKYFSGFYHDDKVYTIPSLFPFWKFFDARNFCVPKNSTFWVQLWVFFAIRNFAFG